MKFLLPVLVFLATASYMRAEPCGIYATVDFLYWRPHVDGIEFVASGFDTDVQGDVREVNWRWDPGFRVGLGRILPCDGWDLSLVFTWYQNRSRRSLAVDPDTSVGPWDVDDNTVSFAQADWRLKYYTLDLNLCKRLCFGRTFSLSPCVALRGARTIEKYDIDYISGGFPDASRNNQRMWAIGPKVGFSTDWYFVPCWSLVCEADFSLLCSSYRVTNLFRGENIPNNMRHLFRTQNFMAQYLFGISWDRGICNNCYHLNFLVAWEQQIWVNHNQMLFGPINFDSLILNRNTNLSLYGITLRGAIGF